MQRRINKKLSSAIRASNREESIVDEEVSADLDDEDEEEEERQSRERAANSRRSRSARGGGGGGASSSRSKSMSKSNNNQTRPSSSNNKKPLKKTVGEFRNSRLGAAFSPTYGRIQDEEDDDDDEEEEEQSKNRRLIIVDAEDGENGLAGEGGRIFWEEEGTETIEDGGEEEEILLRKKFRSSSNDLKAKSGSTTKANNNRRGSGSGSSKESFRRRNSPTSSAPSYYQQPQKRSSFSEKVNAVDYYEDNISSSYDAENSPPESSNTSFTRPLGLASSSVRLPPVIYDLRPSIGGYNQTPSRLGSGSGSTASSNVSSSRDVTALPIELPENVTDEAAFRRYLAVRRGAFVADSPFVTLVDVNSNNSSSYESVGGGCAPKLPAQVAVMQQTLMAQMEGNKRTMTLSYAIMTLALLSASATQLRVLVAYSKAHAYAILNYFLVCLCIIIELAVGMGYVILSRMTNLSEQRVETIHNYLISGLFVVAVANVIIAAFAFDDHVCEVLAKQTDLFDTVDQSQQQAILQ